jgi:hypothetical protein
VCVCVCVWVCGTFSSFSSADNNGPLDASGPKAVHSSGTLLATAHRTRHDLSSDRATTIGSSCDTNTTAAASAKTMADASESQIKERSGGGVWVT